MYKPTSSRAALSLSRRSLHTKVERSYNDVINLLNSSQAGFRQVESWRRAGVIPNERDITQMKGWLHQLGYTPADLNRLNVIHISGTKGKGSTSALTSSILNAYRLSPHHRAPTRVGLYTSPHLTSVRERIRLDESPISEALFARYFSDVWDSLGLGAGDVQPPGYFRLLTLLSFHVFMSEGVDAAVYEVGVGGAFDATNVFESPVATGTVSLGVDHVGQLGATLREIAWHKAGVMKAGAPAFTAPQDPEAMEVLRARAEEVGVPLVEVGVNPGLRNVAVRPDEEFQRRNASMAMELAATLMRRLGVEVDLEGERLPREMVEGIEGVNWRGRCETLVAGGQTWYLDGAHTEESLDVACRWFGRVSKERDTPCALIFNQQAGRDAVDMLRRVHRHLSASNIQINHAVFCTNVTNKDTSTKPDLVNVNVDPDVLAKLTLQNELAETWRALDPSTDVAVVPSIEEAVQQVREKEQLQVFVTGSLHLVGGVLSVLEGDDSGLKSAVGE
ncbi:related to folylpolyglutamate synthase [Cephalotrichum gorgonifer]|uniref:Folylpolyglutamate synthase n=1 Tax=Cephalotrichum gorgonifer TaxID=2041049 RepID=A0AAE8SV97_9PEZI|nr:related to folylpolyglutamate synthase [Cephalotrichum gorgonifer]